MEDINKEDLKDIIGMLIEAIEEGRTELDYIRFYLSNL